MMMNKLWLQLLSFNEESYVPDNRKSMSVAGSNVRPLFIPPPPSFLSFSFHFFLPVYHFLNGSNPQN